MRRIAVLGVLVVLGSGCNDQTIQEGDNQPPVAEAGDNMTVSINEQVSFDGSGSFDPDGAIISYDWDFGDGGTNVGQQVNYSWSTEGTYTVTLTVTDDAGATGTDAPEITIDVEPFPGVYAIQSNPNQQPCGILGNTQMVSNGVDVIINGTDITSDWHWDEFLVDHDANTLTPPIQVLFLNDPPGVTGTLSTATFTMNWSYFQDDQSGVIMDVANVWTGTFNGDGTISSQISQNIDLQGIGNLCTLTWPDVQGTKISELP